MGHMADFQVWYHEDTAKATELANEVLHLVSLSPGHVFSVCDKLVSALCSGAKAPEASALCLCGRSWSTRAELNAECRSILQRYPEDGSQLEGDDASLMRELLRYHPRGEEKWQRCKAVAVGTHPSFERRCFFVVRKHKGGREDFSYARCVDNVVTREVTCQHRICEVIRGILKLHPTSCEQVGRVIENRFPAPHDLRVTIEKHRNWTQCLLYICAEVAFFTEFTLVLLVRKMLDIDVQILKLEENMMDNVDSTDKVQRDLNRLARILDAQMMLMFEFLQRNLSDFKGNASSPLVTVLLGIFQTLVLPTYRAKYVQFLFFYFASLQVSCTENFLIHLLTVVFANEQTLGNRLMAFSYIASFVARASWVPPLFGIKVAQYLTNFCVEIQDAAESLAKEGSNEHPKLQLYIAGVQSICYILCFRISSFVEAEEPEAKGQLQSLLPPWGTARGSGENPPFTPILESSIQPIACIHPVVAQQFCISLRPHFPGIAAQARNCIRRAPRPKIIDSEDKAKPDCEEVFPFDPYRLSGSHIFLLGIYRTWKDHTDADSTEESDGHQGFEAEADVAPTRAHAGSVYSSDADADSDMDFTDMQDATERGFIPSVGPSPAFRPVRNMPMDIGEMSPLCMPMEAGFMEAAAEDDEEIWLPTPSLDSKSANSVLDSLLNSKAFKGTVGN